MAYLSRVVASFLGMCALIIMFSSPGFAATHTPRMLTMTHISTANRATITDTLEESTFLSILSKANRIVLSHYPQAQFYEADGTPKNGRGMTAQDINQWLFIFNNPATRPNSTLKLPYKNGHFGKVQSIPEPFLEDRVIKLPLPTSLSLAVKLLRQHYDAPFTAVTVRFPLYPGVEEPSYIFTLPSKSIWAFVGIYSHKITTESMSS